MNPHVIRVRNVDHALAEGLHWLAAAGIENDSRNGKVLVAPGPVLTVYAHPEERVLVSGLRDANPFFHLYECVWMLGGSNDAEQVIRYAKNMAAFAENGVMWGAYGWRWREYFGFDQLLPLIELLKKDPKTRRAVLTMWAPYGDLAATENGSGGLSAKDVPCNTHVYFDATQGRLDMTVCNRSNDAIWGAYGANAVHMSFLQEFIAAAAGLPLGAYCQMSNNFHAYVEREDVQRLLHKDGARYAVSYRPTCAYEAGVLEPRSLLRHGEHFGYEEFLVECELAAQNPLGVNNYYRNDFFRNVFDPLMRAHAAYKSGDYDKAMAEVDRCLAEDWEYAARDWLRRRRDKEAQAKEWNRV